jgi:hypothetical protein
MRVGGDAGEATGAYVMSEGDGTEPTAAWRSGSGIRDGCAERL